MWPLTGCSHFFNPDNIHKNDAALDTQLALDASLPDSQVIGIADPTLINVDSAYPPLVDEGTGAYGSRPAIVALHGDNFIRDTANLAVAFSPSTAATLVDLKVKPSRPDHQVRRPRARDPDRCGAACRRAPFRSP